MQTDIQVNTDYKSSEPLEALAVMLC